MSSRSHNWARNLAVARPFVNTSERLDPRPPPFDPALAELQIP
jgi:hypothetical protein